MFDSMTEATWRVIDWGKVPKDSRTFSYSCPGCGADAQLPVVGRPLAQFSDGGLVFDVGNRAMPAVIQCRSCRRKFEHEPVKEAA